MTVVVAVVAGADDVTPIPVVPVVVGTTAVATAFSVPEEDTTGTSTSTPSPFMVGVVSTAVLGTTTADFFL